MLCVVRVNAILSIIQRFTLNTVQLMPGAIAIAIAITAVNYSQNIMRIEKLKLSNQKDIKSTEEVSFGIIELYSIMFLRKYWTRRSQLCLESLKRQQSSSLYLLLIPNYLEISS